MKNIANGAIAKTKLSKQDSNRAYESKSRTSGRSRKIRLCEICDEPLEPEEADFGGRWCDGCLGTAARMFWD